jgi:hypothetical protein
MRTVLSDQIHATLGARQRKHRTTMIEQNHLPSPWNRSESTARDRAAWNTM